MSLQKLLAGQVIADPEVVQAITDLNARVDALNDKVDTAISTLITRIDQVEQGATINWPVVLANKTVEINVTDPAP